MDVYVNNTHDKPTKLHKFGVTCTDIYGSHFLTGFPGHFWNP